MEEIIPNRLNTVLFAFGLLLAFSWMPMEEKATDGANDWSFVLAKPLAETAHRLGSRLDSEEDLSSESHSGNNAARPRGGRQQVRPQGSAAPRSVSHFAPVATRLFRATPEVKAPEPQPFYCVFLI